mgnify:CR=1 FL=1
MMPLAYREPTPEDAGRVVAFWQESGASMGAGDSVERVRRAIANPATLLVVAEAGPDVVGTLRGAFDGWRGNMYRLAVHPSRRREGNRPWAIAFWTAVGYPHDPRIVRHVGTLDA